jgi:hypothetical protein
MDKAQDEDRKVRDQKTKQSPRQKETLMEDKRLYHFPEMIRRFVIAQQLMENDREFISIQAFIAQHCPAKA